MSEPYFRRSLEPVLRRAAREFAVVVVTGPRQSGKTTLLRRLFGATHRYVSLEPPDVRVAASTDPRGFLAAFPPAVIYDEVQYAPDLLAYVKEHVDAHPGRRGQFLLTGSQNLLVLERVTETLAGRAAVLRLLPLARREAEGRPDKPLPWERAEGRMRHGADGIVRGLADGRRRAPRVGGHAGGAVTGVRPEGLWASLLRGSYPQLAAEPRRDARLWHASYVQTYLERDVRGVRQVGELLPFQSFLRLVAARSGQLLNLSDLSRDLGLAVNTVKAWLSVLEATHQVVIVRPYFANVGKRLVKTPKVYLADTGTLCHLTGLRDPRHAGGGPLAGAIFETAVASEIAKALWHRGEVPAVYFWRTSAGVEVDFVVDTGERLVPLEVKLSATPRPEMAAGIASFRRDLGPRAARGYVVHPGDVALPLGPDAVALPFGEL